MQSSTSSQITNQQNPSFNTSNIKSEAISDINVQRQTVINLIKGEILKGEILDLRFDSLKLLLSSGQVLSASYDSTVPLSIGEQVFCRVESNDPNLLHLKLMDSSTTKSDVNPTIQKALSEASLPINPKNQQIVHTLMNYQMSIDKNSILSLLRQSARIPDASVDSLALMNKYQMPITPSNAAQFEAYQHYEYRLNEQVGQLFHQITTFLSDIKDPVQQLTTINQMIQLLTNDSNPMPVSNNLAKNYQLPISNKNEQSYPSTDRSSNPESVVKDAIIKESLPSDASTQHPNLSFSSTTTDIPSSTHTSLIKELRECFMSHFTLPVDELKEPHKITRFYEDMENDIKKLHSFFHEHEAEGNTTHNTEISNQLDQMKGNLDFMKTLNQIFTYVQVPIHLPSKDVHSELFVYTDKRKLRAGNEDVSVLLHLDMPSLGPIDFHLRLKEHFLTAKVSLQEEEAYYLVKNHLPELQTKLQSEGYDMTYEIEQVEELKRVIPNQLKQEENYSTIRYSFDQRA